jgi:hypothetical protein
MLKALSDSPTTRNKVRRYSQLYIENSNPLPDSKRACLRIGKLMELVTKGKAAVLSEVLERELGVRVGVSSSQFWPRFCGNCETRDLLDTISLAFRFVRQNGSGDQFWLQQTRRIFAEEHLAYAIDDDGVVHPAIDQEFQRNRRTTVAALQSARYANSLVAFERVSDELASDPPNGKDAWRSVFTAVEGLFRLMFRSAPQLNAATVEAHLPGLVQKLYGGDVIALRATIKLVAAFKDWVDSGTNRVARNRYPY